MKLILIFLMTVSTTCFATPNNFRESKKILKKIYGNNKTFYCSCLYLDKKVDHKSCGYEGKKKKNGEEYYKKRSERIEWEHIFPVSKAIGAFSECRGKGYLDKKTGKRKNLSRKKCLKVSEGFRKLEANLFNLVPAVGSLNAVRSNYSFAEIEGEHREWGKCDFEKVGRKIEPQDSVKGDIARVYFYLEKEYPYVGVISKKNRKLFEVWDKMDSVSKEECEINKLKSKYQGNENLFVSKHCNKS